MNKYDYIKLRSSVSVVKIHENILEFFLSDIRTQVRIKVESDTILEIVSGLDGTRTFSEILADLEINDSVTESHLVQLFDFLLKKSVLVIDGKTSSLERYDSFRRVIHFLENYSSDFEDLQFMWTNIRNANVVIIGLGAVGSWVTINLAQSGVKKFVLMDKDKVEITNLHRQLGYTESDIGSLKTDALEKRLMQLSDDIVVKKINAFLDGQALFDNLNGEYDLIINCADKPSVDQTSLWVGEYCMKKNIPHIIGGGYNLHLSLVGQTIIPYQTACVKCYEKQLKKINAIDIAHVKKMETANRKIGSFGPLCALNASLIGIEAIKVLTKKIPPVNVNRRGEFNIYSMNFRYTNFNRLNDCEWCGNGKDEGNTNS